MTQYLVYADEPKGLGVRVSPQNRKTFILDYRSEGKSRRMTLGKYPNITVDQAKDLARKHLGEVSMGRDPVETKRRKQVDSLKVKDLVDRHLVEYIDRKRSVRGRKDVRDDFNRYILPIIAKVPLSKIERAHILKVLGPLEGRSRTYNVCRSYMKTMFSNALRWGLIRANPVDGIDKFQEHSREEWVKPKDLKKLHTAIEAYENVYVRGLYKILMYTAVRKSEAQNMKWEHLDLNNQIWTIPKTKNGRRHEVHLTKPAMKILKELPRVVGNPYVFVGEKPGRPYNAVGKVWTRIRANAKLEKYTLHDIRRTMASYLAQDKIPRDRIGQILNHTDRSVTGIYAHLTFKDKKDTWERLAELIEDVLSQKDETEEDECEGENLSASS